MRKKITFSKKSFTVLASLFFIGIFVAVMALSYAFFTSTVISKDFVIYTGNLAVNYEKRTNVINVLEAYPMTNAQGLATTAHGFTVRNIGNIVARYQVRFELDDTSNLTVSPEYVKMSYKIDDGSYSEPILLSNLGSNLVFISDLVLAPTSSNNIDIKLWIDINAPNDIQGKTFRARVVIDSIQNVEDGYILDTAPIIYLRKDNMGSTDINLNVNDTYTELGVDRIADDKDLLSINQVVVTYQYYDGTNLSTVAGVNTSNAGIYYVTYSITDSDNNTSKVVRTVTINPANNIPTISLIGNSTITIVNDSTFVDPGVTVASGDHVTTLGEIKTTTPGTYTLKYIVIDNNGNMNSITRTVIVQRDYVLADNILNTNTLITQAPTLTTSSNNASDTSGLYSSTATNSGDSTYYFRGNVNNNYVSFGGQTWRIIRINEDGTVRMIMQDSINNAIYTFNSDATSTNTMYYSNSNFKSTLELWYANNIGSNSAYSSKVSSGNYYCEQAKAAYNSNFATNSGTNMVAYTSYEPNFRCTTDANGKGVINSSIGLINYDEVVYAGGYNGKANIDYYLYDNTNYWTTSPAGFDGSNAYEWYVASNGRINFSNVSNSGRLHPVINLKADTRVTGTGISTDPYVVH